MRDQRRSVLGLLVLFLGLFSVACGGGGGGGPENELAGLYPTGTTGPGTGGGGGGGSTGSGGGGSGGGGTTALTFRVEISGDFALATSPAFPVARTQAEFTSLWQQYIPPIKTFAPTTPIDFSKDMAVGVFLGGRPTSGYSVAVLTVEQNGDGATVNWEERQPDPNGVGPTVVTSPFVLIVMPQVTGAIDFNGKVTVVKNP
jgi:hypothetical protein